MAPAVKVKPARVTESPATIFAALNVTLAVSVELVEPPCCVVMIKGAVPDTGAAKSVKFAPAVPAVVVITVVAVPVAAKLSTFAVGVVLVKLRTEDPNADCPGVVTRAA